MQGPHKSGPCFLKLPLCATESLELELVQSLDEIHPISRKLSMGLYILAALSPSL